MSAHEVPITRWSEFLDQFSREHRAWLATVDRRRPGSLEHVEAIERPLASVVPHGPTRRIERIEIRFQGDPQTREPIQINDPTVVRVEMTPQGVARGLEIVDGDGECTRIRFRAAPLPEMLDGLAPGEVSPP
jgi:hypothetical protein